MKNCYTYLIGWKKLNTWYYGRRTANGCKPGDLWNGYYTSSIHVKNFRKIHGDPDIIEVRRVFGEMVSKCKLWESIVLRRIRARENSQFLNKTNGDNNFDATGRASAKDKNGNNLGLISTNDVRWKTGDIISTAKGLIRQTKAAKDKNGNNLGGICINDIRWKSGEIIDFNTGIPAIHNKNNAPAISSITGKSLGRISLNDIRWKTREIVSPMRNQVVVKDKDGKTKRVSVTDPGYISGELVHVCVGNKKSAEDKELLQSSAISARKLNRVSDIITKKEYSIQNFTRYILNPQS